MIGSVAEAREAALEEVMVTGSRLRRDGMSTPTPVTAVQKEEMRSMVPTLLMDAISQLPEFRDNDTTPRRLYSTGVRSRVITTARIIASGPLAGIQFVDSEVVSLSQAEVHGNVMIGGGNPDLVIDWESLAPKDERSSVFSHYMHDFGNDREFFVQALKGKHAVTSTPSPFGFAPAWSTRIFADYPYLPESVRVQMEDLGLESFDFSRSYE